MYLVLDRGLLKACYEDLEIAISCVEDCKLPDRLTIVEPAGPGHIDDFCVHWENGEQNEAGSTFFQTNFGCMGNDWY